MEVVVANRSPVATSPLVDRSFLLDDLAAFWGRRISSLSPFR